MAFITGKQSNHECAALHVDNHAINIRPPGAYKIIVSSRALSGMLAAGMNWYVTLPSCLSQVPLTLLRQRSTNLPLFHRFLTHAYAEDWRRISQHHIHRKSLATTAAVFLLFSTELQSGHGRLCAVAKTLRIVNA